MMVGDFVKIKDEYYDNALLSVSIWPKGKIYQVEPVCKAAEWCPGITLNQPAINAQLNGTWYSFTINSTVYAGVLELMSPCMPKMETIKVSLP